VLLGTPHGLSPAHPSPQVQQWAAQRANRTRSVVDFDHAHLVACSSGGQVVATGIAKSCLLSLYILEFP